MSPQDGEVRAQQMAQQIVGLLNLGDHIKGPNTSKAVIEAYIADAIKASRIAAFDRAIEKLQELAVKNGSANDGYFAALRDAAEILTRERDGA